jgi:hypothetical protein
MAFEKTEGGHSRGHSNMNHWGHTQEIKKAARKTRRRLNKQACRFID